MSKGDIVVTVGLLVLMGLIGAYHLVQTGSIDNVYSITMAKESK